MHFSAVSVELADIAVKGLDLVEWVLSHGAACNECSSILQFHLFISQNNMALLELLESYGMESPDGLPNI